MKEINKNLSLLYYHLKSFMGDKGELHSLNITYWGQEFKSTANIMNAYPFICGIIELLKNSDNNELKDTLHQLIDFILASQGKYGFFRHSYGDITNTPAPPIIQIATDISLLKYYELTNDANAIEAVIKNLKFIRKKYLKSNILQNHVVNQNSYLLKFLLI
ncbi:hypothetical protein J7L48_06430, partial [bacterium]|nr:hypothetical protein [bacterium]